MMLSYDDVSVPVRADLAAAHERAWQHIAAPGTWWTGAERCAIAAEVRQALDCRLCAERKTALSPYTVTGEHDHRAALPPPVIDMIHRVTTDPGRLGRPWFDSLLDSGLDDARYVETLGVIVLVVCIDSFCHAIGAPLHALPAPLPGEPSRHRPAGALPEQAWVPMIAASRARGPEADLYSIPRPPNVVRALSLVPDAVRALQDLLTAQYVRLRDIPHVDRPSGRAVTRMQMELIAARVSALNQCFY